MSSLVNSIHLNLHTPPPKQLSSGGVPKNQSRVVQPKMAPNLASSRHELIYDMVHSGAVSVKEMELAAGCDKSLFQIKNVWQRQSTAN
jgi:hypothetical protein